MSGGRSNSNTTMDAKSKTRGVWWGSLAILGIALSVAAPTLGKNKNIYTVEGVPKPDNHLVDWLGKHQVYAKQNLEECQSCHTNQMFCANCHERRDTVQQTVHRRNFRISHSIHEGETWEKKQVSECCRHRFDVPLPA